MEKTRINRDNFFENTQGVFVRCETPSYFDYISASGSKYTYTDYGVIRTSNHWGRVASCNWNLSDKKNYDFLSCEVSKITSAFISWQELEESSLVLNSLFEKRTIISMDYYKKLESSQTENHVMKIATHDFQKINEDINVALNCEI